MIYKESKTVHFVSGNYCFKLRLLSGKNSISSVFAAKKAFI
jgi:hypothetical protein